MRASSTDPATWSAFETAQAAVADGKADGFGFVLGGGYAGVDLDACRDPETGVMTVEAQAFIDGLSSYTEISPSGSGVHILLRGGLLPGGRRQGHVEIYADGRYFTITGHHLEGTPTTIEERTAELAALHGRLFGHNGGKGDHQSVPRPVASVATDDAALLERARGASNGTKFSALWAGDTTGYSSSSEADLALSRLLAFWTHGDAGRIDRLVRASGLFRPKWDERRGTHTYGELTIEKAIAGCRQFYTGIGPLPLATRHEPTAGHASTAAMECDTGPAPLLLSPADPLPSARAFVALSYLVDGLLALRHHAGVFYAYQPVIGAYHDLDEPTMRAALYLFLEDAQWRPTRKASSQRHSRRSSPQRAKLTTSSMPCAPCVTCPPHVRLRAGCRRIPATTRSR
jgi:hypothetical protein